MTPAQQTTKAVVETYLTELLGWGRTCHAKLDARGADAKRYEFIP